MNSHPFVSSEVETRRVTRFSTSIPRIEVHPELAEGLEPNGGGE
ncbi:MAG TPA: hypothetical protein VFP14_08255 [Novosphingobium sp.]|nr:hypothetical protein [Novosphingobium sp.]